MTPLLLDTHAWIWLAAGHERMIHHEKLLNRTAAEKALLIATITLYEASLIGLETDRGERRGRHAVRMLPTVATWIRDTLRATRVVPVPLDAEMATDAASFQTMHADPFDRLIVASAIHAKARLATADAKIIQFAKAAGVQVLEL